MYGICEPTFHPVLRKYSRDHKREVYIAVTYFSHSIEFNGKISSGRFRALSATEIA